MPIYEYRRADGTTFEVFQKITEEPLTADPETGQPVERVFSPVAVHFKGSGFYNTDYGKRKRGSGGGEDKKAEKADGPKTDSGSSSAKSDNGSSAKASGSKAEAG